MLLDKLTRDATDALDWGWDRYQAPAQDLLDRPLTPETLDDWMRDWSDLGRLLTEVMSRLYVATTLDTGDEAARERFQRFLGGVMEPAQAHDQAMKTRLLASGLSPANFEVPLRNLRAEAALFREENLPLITEHMKTGMEYDQIIGAQMVSWRGEEMTLTQLASKALPEDRATREEAWRLGSERVLEDREQINAIWQKLLPIRQKLAENAGYTSYRDYAWQEKLRFDYTPEDCRSFQDAIEEVVVPAAARLYERRRVALGVDVLRPWDLSANPMRTTDLGVTPPGQLHLNPFADEAELIDIGQRIFDLVDPALGGYFKTMKDERLLDLMNRKGKAAGAYCTGYPLKEAPFVFGNSTGGHEDLQTLFHELGHAFHVFEMMQGQTLIQQMNQPIEFAEVASMGMELLTAPYLTKDKGGIYTPAEAAQARIDHLDSLIVFWPYMAVVDAFQHWVYEDIQRASDTAACDAKWDELWGRFIVGVDWSGLDADRMTGWHRKVHLYRSPFYYVEYGLAQLGAVQVWANARKDQAAAVKQYRAALALGGNAPLPKLFEAAGARFAFDAATLKMAVDLIETTVEELEAQR